MKKQAGFTFIELVMFIVVTGLLATGILLGYVGALGKYPVIIENSIAMQTAKQCADWYLGQRRLNGYSSVSGSNCASTLTIPGICSVPGGYALTGTCSTTTIGSDSNFETITLSVSGPGNASITLLLGNY